MKGLLVKDFKLLKAQRNLFLANIAIAIGLFSVYENPGFIVGYLTFLMSMFALGTISYDEFDNGNAFLFTLPISRKNYVVEKYGFSLLLGGGAWIFATILAAVVVHVKGTAPVWEVGMTALWIAPVLLILLAVMIPLQLQFGAEKARIVVVGAGGLCAGLGFLIVKLAERSGVDPAKAADALFAVHWGTLLAIAAAASGLLFALSIKISVSILEKKEF